VLDSANYGAISINKAVTITAESAVAGTPAIVINAGPTELVSLRGLDVRGDGTAAIGIQVNSGSLSKSSISNYRTAGIQIAGSSPVFVHDTSFSENNYGLFITSAVAVTLSRLNLTNNGAALYLKSGSAMMTDVVASGNYYGHVVTGARATLRNCTVSGNAVGIRADAGTVTLTGCTVFGNQVGLQSLNGGVLQSYGNNNLMDPGAGATSLALK
jgi:Right handed beta helix region